MVKQLRCMSPRAVGLVMITIGLVGLILAN